MSDHKIVPLRPDEIRYLRNGLEARLAGEAGEDPVVSDLVLPPGAARQTALVEETVVFTELDVALGRTVAEVASKEDS